MPLENNTAGDVYLMADPDTKTFNERQAELKEKDEIDKIEKELKLK